MRTAGILTKNGSMNTEDERWVERNTCWQTQRSDDLNKIPTPKTDFRIADRRAEPNLSSVCCPLPAWKSDTRTIRGAIRVPIKPRTLHKKPLFSKHVKLSLLPCHRNANIVAPPSLRVVLCFSLAGRLGIVCFIQVGGKATNSTSWVGFLPPFTHRPQI